MATEGDPQAADETGSDSISITQVRRGWTRVRCNAGFRPPYPSRAAQSPGAIALRIVAISAAASSWAIVTAASGRRCPLIEHPLGRRQMYRVPAHHDHLDSAAGCDERHPPPQRRRRFAPVLLAHRVDVLLRPPERLLNRPAGRRGLFVPHQDGREHSPTLRAGKVRAGAGTKTAGVAPGLQTARRRTGVPGHRPASGATPEGFCELVAAPVGAQGRRVGDRRVDQPRNHPADAEKNGMTQRKIEYWVIPPQADAEFVANISMAGNAAWTGG